jgi:hypothetical protein
MQLSQFKRRFAKQVCVRIDKETLALLERARYELGFRNISVLVRYLLLSGARRLLRP